MPQYDRVAAHQRARGPISPVWTDEVMVGHKFLKCELGPILSRIGNKGFEGVLGELGFDLDRFDDIKKVDEGDFVYYYQGYARGDRPHG